MVQTPWGASGSLRERRLQPVRGTPHAEVEKNQRERLFAALVASVAERGFATTTVSELVELSGVSSRSFYDHFGDMQRGMTALVEELLALARSEFANQEEASDLESEERRRYAGLASLVAAQPAAAKVLLSEVFAAGPEALKAVEQAIARYERDMRTRYEANPERKGTPERMITAITGGVLEIVRRRIRENQVEELPALGKQIVPAALAYRPPPKPLRPGARRKRANRESLEAADHSERAIRALAVLCAERGYQATTVDDVVKLASMSSRTFYANFTGKEDLMKTAIDSACAQLVAAAMPAFTRHEAWPAGIRAGFGAMLGFLASRPALARLLAVETQTAGDFAVERRIKGLTPLGLLLENNTTAWLQVPPIAYELIAGGVMQLVHREIVRSGPQGLPGLAPILTYWTLSPFFEPPDACAMANGDDAERPKLPSKGGILETGDRAIPLSLPMRQATWSVVVALRDRTVARREGPLSAAEIAEEVGEDPAEVAEFLQQLATAGLIVADEQPDGEVRYRSLAPEYRLNLVSTQQAAQMTLEEREAVTAQVKTLVDGDAITSMERHVMDQRPDRTFTRSVMRLDEQGWRELADWHAEMLRGEFDISERSEARLAESGEEPIEVRSVQMMFEMPREEKRGA